MSRSASDSKDFVLSFRVNERERKLLLEASAKTGVPLSTLLRQSISTIIKEMQSG